MLRLLTDDAGCFLNGERSDGVKDLVVGMAQGGEDAVEHQAPLTRITLLELPLLGIRLDGGIADDGLESGSGKAFETVGAATHETVETGVEAFPILGSTVDGKNALGQTDEALYVVGKSLGSGLR